jgi:tetratricopeptide (TPR) repeat protein
MRRLLSFIVILCFYQNTHACLNLFGIDSSGHRHHIEHRFIDNISFNQKYIREKAKQHAKMIEAGQVTYKEISDYGAYLLMAGQSAEGLYIFKQLIQKYPSDYTVNANLGVAYELNGNLDSALFYVKKAVSIDPRSHRGSEHVHIQFLEVKKELATSSNVIPSKKILDINFKSDGPGAVNSTLQHALYQLNERLPFTLGVEPAMGWMFTEMGDGYMNQSVYRAYFCYQLAVYFHPMLLEQIKPKMEKAKKTWEEYAARERAAGGNLWKNRETGIPTDKEISDFKKDLDQRPAALIKNMRIVARPRLDVVIAGLS